MYVFYANNVFDSLGNLLHHSWYRFGYLFLTKFLIDRETEPFTYNIFT
jgi:hypothetical protein